MDLFVRVDDGTDLRFETPTSSTTGQVKELVASAGMSGPEGTVIISEFPLPTWKGPVDWASDSFGELPAIPVPASPSTHLPEVSASKIVSTARLERPFLKFEGAYFDVDWLTKHADLNPDFPSDAQLMYAVNWRQIESWTIRGPVPWSQEVTRTEGMRKTNSDTFSLQLGIEKDLTGVSDTFGKFLPKLSATLTRQLKTEVQVYSEERVTEKYSLDVPFGTVCRFTIWTLESQFVIADSSGDELDYQGRARLLFGWRPVRFESTRAVGLARNASLDPHYFDAKTGSKLTELP